MLSLLIHTRVHARVHAQFLSHDWLFCDPTDHSPPCSSAHGILQSSVLEWVAISSSRDPPDPGIEPVSLIFPALAGDSLPLRHQGTPHLLTRSPMRVSDTV